METMSRAGFSLVRSSLATLIVVRSRLKKNLMENLSRTTHWLRHHDRLRPSGQWRGTESVIGELEGQVMAIVCLVSPSFGSSCCLFRQVLWFFDENVLKRCLSLLRQVAWRCTWSMSCPHVCYFVSTLHGFLFVYLPVLLCFWL